MALLRMKKRNIDEKKVLFSLKIGLKCKNFRNIARILKKNVGVLRIFITFAL